MTNHIEATGRVHGDLGWAGSLWMFAAPAADIRAMSVGGSCCIHCAIVRRRLAPPSTCRRSPNSDTRHEASAAISRLLGTSPSSFASPFSHKVWSKKAQSGSAAGAANNDRLSQGKAAPVAYPPNLNHHAPSSSLSDWSKISIRSPEHSTGATNIQYKNQQTSRIEENRFLPKSRPSEAVYRLPDQ